MSKVLFVCTHNFHETFEDPTQFKGSEEEILKQVRRVRNEIKEWIKKTFA